MPTLYLPHSGGLNSAGFALKSLYLLFFFLPGQVKTREYLFPISTPTEKISTKSNLLRNVAKKQHSETIPGVTLPATLPPKLTAQEHRVLKISSCN